MMLNKCYSPSNFTSYIFQHFCYFSNIIWLNQLKNTIANWVWSTFSLRSISSESRGMIWSSHSMTLQGTAYSVKGYKAQVRIHLSRTEKMEVTV